eukprot:TRINITY_DN1184_c0_g3_i1.p1 TRINITY_DN1184_c0_g3~~TRINITY_DN1184_c0_g3_i1.p1  ORF type:complete len:130 (+),score=24.02 TRINITY_DN1184_c0_g3_i1:125-514(+)
MSASSSKPPETETLNISDGTTMLIARVPDIDDETWKEVKAFVEGDPETAKKLQSFARNPEAVRGWFQTQAIAEHYKSKLTNKDEAVTGKLTSLEEDPELIPIFEDIKKNGLEARRWVVYLLNCSQRSKR